VPAAAAQGAPTPHHPPTLVTAESEVGGLVISNAFLLRTRPKVDMHIASCKTENPDARQKSKRASRVIRG
jgi:hypothetical protein